MSDVDANAQAPAAPVIRVLGQKIKDLSFENPGTEALAQAGQNPDIDLAIDVNARRRSPQDPIFETDLRMRANAKIGDQVLFIIELVYTGITEVRNIPEKDLEPVLMVEIPRLMFPFARRIVAEITQDGGFPPLFVEPVDFMALFNAQRQAKAQAAAGDQPQTN